MANDLGLGIEKLGVEISADTEKATKNIIALTEALNPLRTKSNSASKSVNKLAEAFKNLNSVNTGKIKEMSNAMSNTSNNIRSFSKASNEASKSSSSMMSSISKSTSFMRNVRRIYQRVSQVTMEMLSASTQYVETLNKMEVAFGSASKSVKAYAQEVEQYLGIDMREWLDYQSTFGSLMKGMKVNTQDTQLMSQNLTQLAYDYSSLYNVDVATAFKKLSSAMSGQVKGLKEYGNNVSVAMVNQTLQQHGIDVTVSKLDSASQAYARYITIMNNASNTGAFRDLNKTIGTTANQMRIASAQVEIFKRNLGSIVNVIAQNVLPYINLLMQVVNKLMTTLFGGFIKTLDNDVSSMNTSITSATDNTKDLSNSVGDTSKGLDKATKSAEKYKKSIRGFDELNLIPAPNDSSSSSGSGGSSGSSGGVVDMSGYDWSKLLPTYDFFDRTETKVDELMKKLGDVFKPLKDSWDKYGASIMFNASNVFNDIKAIALSLWDSVSRKWDKVFGALSNLFMSVNDTSTLVLSAITNAFRQVWEKGGKTLFEGILDISVAFIEIATEINDNFVKPIIRAFNKYITPIVTTVLGSILKVIGSLLTELSKSKTLLYGIIALVGITKLSKYVVIITKLAKTLGGIGPTIRTISIASPTLTKAFAVFDKAKGVVSTLLSNSYLGAFAPTFTGIAVASGLLIVAWDKWSTSFTKAGQYCEKLKETVSKTTDEVKELGSSFAESEKNAKSSIKDTEMNAQMLSTNISMLKKLVGSNGVVKDMSKARQLVAQINGIMPNTVTLTKNGKIEWHKTAQEVEKYKKNLVESAKTQAYMDLFNESVKKQDEAQTKLNATLKKQREAYKKLQQAKKLNAEGKGSATDVIKYRDAYLESTKAVKEQTKVVSDLNNKMGVYEQKISGSQATSKRAIADTNKLLKTQQSQLSNIQGEYSITVKADTSNIKTSVQNSFNGLSAVVKAKVDSANLKTTKTSIEKGTKPNSQLVTVKPESSSTLNKLGETIRNKLKSVINKTTATSNLGIGQLMAQVGGVASTLGKVSLKAKGLSSGLPSKGELFMANERGAELVGSVGGRGFVANQNDIFNMITTGIANGLAMTSRNNNNGNITINVISQLDKREVGRSVVEYHNGVVRQTGSTPLII